MSGPQFDSFRIAVGYALAMTRIPVSPSAVTTASASQLTLSRLKWLDYTHPCRTLRPRPRGRRRTARGRCGSLFLHRSGLAPPTRRRPPGAPVTVTRGAVGKQPVEHRAFGAFFISARGRAECGDRRRRTRPVRRVNSPRLQRLPEENWSGRRESNPRMRLGKLLNRRSNT